MQAQRNSKVGRRGTAKHGQGEVWRHGLDPTLHEPLVLDFRIGNAAQRGTDIDTKAIRPRAPSSTDGQACVFDRHPPRGQRKMAEAVGLPRCFGVHVVGRLEVVYLRGDLRAELARVEPIYALDRQISVRAGPPRSGLAQCRWT